MDVLNVLTDVLGGIKINPLSAAEWFQLVPNILGWIEVIKKVVPPPMLARLLVHGSFTGEELCERPGSTDCKVVINLCQSRLTEVFNPQYAVSALRDVIVFVLVVLALVMFKFNKFRLTAVFTVYLVSLVGQASVFKWARSHCKDDESKQVQMNMHTCVSLASGVIQMLLFLTGPSAVTKDIRQVADVTRRTETQVANLNKRIETVESHVAVLSMYVQQVDEMNRNLAMALQQQQQSVPVSMIEYDEH